MTLGTHPNETESLSGIRRDAAGRWFKDGDPVTHPKLVRSFNEWLERDEQGRYLLRNAINWAYIELEGPPLFVRALQVQHGRLTVELSDGAIEVLRPESLRQTPDGGLYCDARAGTLYARFDNHALTSLSPWLREEAGQMSIQIGDKRFPVPMVDSPWTSPAV